MNVLMPAFAAILVALHIAAGYLHFVATDQLPELPTPRAYLIEECEERGCDFALLDAIVTCESKWIMVQNRQSSAHGYFQILDSTERGTPQYEAGRRKTNPYANIDMGVYLYERYGTSPWNESKACWLTRYQAYRAASTVKSAD